MFFKYIIAYIIYFVKLPLHTTPDKTGAMSDWCLSAMLAPDAPVQPVLSSGVVRYGETQNMS
jgi:hypothetical protein